MIHFRHCAQCGRVEDASDVEHPTSSWCELRHFGVPINFCSPDCWGTWLTEGENRPGLKLWEQDEEVEGEEPQA